MFKISQALKTSLMVLVVSGVTAAHAAAPLTCVSATGPTGGNDSITITEKGSKSFVSGFAQGGMAHFVTKFGPFAAKKEIIGEIVTYTWEDQFHQFGTATITTRMIHAHAFRIATTDYGMWSDGPLTCMQALN